MAIPPVGRNCELQTSRTSGCQHSPGSNRSLLEEMDEVGEFDRKNCGLYLSGEAICAEQ